MIIAFPEAKNLMDFQSIQRRCLNAILIIYRFRFQKPSEPSLLNDYREVFNVSSQQQTTADTYIIQNDDHLEKITNMDQLNFNATRLITLKHFCRRVLAEEKNTQNSIVLRERKLCHM